MRLSTSFVNDFSNASTPKLTTPHLVSNMPLDRFWLLTAVLVQASRTRGLGLGVNKSST
jgi:hypothetical protein